MDQSAAEEFTQTVEQHLGASWRQMAWALKEGVPEALGLTAEQWGGRLRNRVRLDVEERRKAALELYHQDKMTVREIGIALGVNHSTVVRDLKPPGANAPPPEPEPQASRPELEPPGANAPPPELEAGRPLSKAELLEQLKDHGIDVQAVTSHGISGLARGYLTQANP